MTKRPTHQTIARRFAAHDAQHGSDCPHCARIIAQQGSLGINRPMVAEIEEMLATATRVTFDGLTEEEALAVLMGGDRPIRFADPEEAMTRAKKIMAENAEALRLMASYDQGGTDAEFDSALQAVIDEDGEALRGMTDK